MKRLRTHVRTNVVGYIALFFSLSLGTAWAASLPDNSVGTDQLRDQGVANADLRDGTVGSEEIRTNGVQGIDVRDGSLLCRDFASSEAACARGATGPAGADAVGGAGFTKTTVRSHTETIELTCESSGETSLSCSGQETARVSCASGEQATGGGYELSPSVVIEGGNFRDGNSTHQTSFPNSAGEDVPDPTSGTPIAWQVDATGTGSSFSQAGNPTPPPDPTVTVYVICASSGTPTGA